MLKSVLALRDARISVIQVYHSLSVLVFRGLQSEFTIPNQMNDAIHIGSVSRVDTEIQIDSVSLHRCVIHIFGMSRVDTEIQIDSAKP
jgi:hypothetical protein